MVLLVLCPTRQSVQLMLHCLTGRLLDHHAVQETLLCNITLFFLPLCHHRASSRTARSRISRVAGRSRPRLGLDLRTHRDLLTSPYPNNAGVLLCVLHVTEYAFLVIHAPKSCESLHLMPEPGRTPTDRPTSWITTIAWCCDLTR